MCRWTRCAQATNETIHKKNSQGGFTAAEMVVSTMVMAILGIVFLNVLNSGMILYAKNTAVNSAHEEAREGIIDSHAIFMRRSPCRNSVTRLSMPIIPLPAASLSLVRHPPAVLPLRRLESHFRTLFPEVPTLSGKIRATQA